MAPVPPRSAANIPSLGYGDYVRFGKLLLDRCGLHFSESRRPELELGIRQAFADAVLIETLKQMGFIAKR